MHRTTPLLALLAALASAQHTGVHVAEVHPSLSWKQCDAFGQCAAVNGKVVLDANWRWLPRVGSVHNCFTGNEWNDLMCSGNPDLSTCQCALEGADYRNVHGITTSSDALSLRYQTAHQHGTTLNSRVFLLDTPDRYKTFTLADNEVTFDVDLSAVPCGLNSRLYFVDMEADGGKARYPTNRAGAKYGTGYCDATCTRSQKYVAGQASIRPWTCCPEATI